LIGIQSVEQGPGELFPADLPVAGAVQLLEALGQAAAGETGRFLTPDRYTHDAQPQAKNHDYRSHGLISFRDTWFGVESVCRRGGQEKFTYIVVESVRRRIFKPQGATL
jgi:hypothetical protein